MNTQEKNFLKDGLALSLFIGILGSALWEKLLSPLADRLFVLINNWISQFSQASSNALYISISEGYNGNFSTIIVISSYYSFVMITLLTLYLSLRFSYHQKVIVIDRKDEPKKITYPIRNLRWKHIFQELRALLILLESIVLLLSTFYITGRIEFINNSIRTYSNNLEIISPYISDLEYKQFKSRFHLIKCKEDYDSLILAIEAIANSHDITLK